MRSDEFAILAAKGVEDGRLAGAQLDGDDVAIVGWRIAVIT
jgi:hypothetical protein